MINKRQKNTLFWVCAAIIAVAALAFFGKAGYDYFHHEYLVSTHPIMYKEYVEENAEKNTVNKFLVFAIIKTESGYNKDAVSSAGARGLMQLTEETFEWVKAKLGDDDTVSFDDMFDEETNIRYGTYLISFLIRYFDSEELAVCAYHAGIGSVESWLSNEKYSDDGRTLLTVPMQDTAHYLSKINEAKTIYTSLY